MVLSVGGIQCGDGAPMPHQSTYPHSSGTQAAHGRVLPSRVWVSSVNPARLSPLPPCITLSRLNKSVNGGARSKPRDYPQHHQHMLNHPLHAIPQRCSATESCRTLPGPYLRIWERRVSHRVMCAPSLLHARRVPHPTAPVVGQSTSCVGCGGFGMSPWICCSRLQMAAPIGRLPLTGGGGGEGLGPKGGGGG